MSTALIVPTLAVLVLVACTAASDVWQVEDLGVPINAVTYANSHGVLANAPGGEGTMFYIAYYRSTGSELVGYDSRRDVAFRKPLGSDGGYGLTVGRDGCIYAGGVNPGDIYRYDPATDSMTTIDVKRFGVQYIWDAATAQDGTIYCAAGYPQSRLVAFHPETRDVRDLGEMVPGEKYLRSLCVDALGKVWCGVGIHAHLIVYDPADGSKQNVLPEAYAQSSSVYDLVAVGQYVVATVLQDGILLVYDAKTRQVVRTLPRPENDIAWSVADGAGDNTVYLETFPAQKAYRYDIQSGSLEPLFEGVGQLKLVCEDRWAHLVDDQDYVVYDLQNKKTIERRRLTEGGDGMHIQALAPGPDGYVYGSKYINMHLFRCNIGTGALIDLGKCSRWAGQVDSMSLGHDGRIYIGAYVHAVLSVYDPKALWRPGRDHEANSREIGPIGKGQYRTGTNCLGPDGRLYVGSIPSYRSAPTGAFTICDPKTGAMDCRTDFVTGGGVNYLVADNAYVYGTGGGEFFVYDPAKDEKLFTDKRAVSALSVLENGKIVGSGNGKLFIYDRAVNGIITEEANPAGDFSHMARGRDAHAYGINATHIARVDAGLSVSVLAQEGGHLIALDDRGRIYFARGAKLLRCLPIVQ